MEKVLHSAIANAQNLNEDVDVDDLYVSEAYVNEGPRQKRVRPAPMGRAYRYQSALGAHRGESGGEGIESEHGTESSSLRLPAGIQQALALALVLEAGTTPQLLQEDLELKEGLRKQLKSAGVSSIEVDRPGNKLRVTIRTSRPGIIIGRKGAEIEKLKTALAKKTKREVFIDIQEVHKPELDAQLVSESIALQLEKRVAFRRAMRKAVDSALRFGCKGIKVRVSGRLNGAEIARSEWYLQGQLPLHTLRADIDYGFTEAHTTYGVIGVKAWLYKGEILPNGKRTGMDDGEPRRNERPRGDRDRGDRGDRRGPRPDRGPGDRGPGDRAIRRRWRGQARPWPGADRYPSARLNRLCRHAPSEAWTDRWTDHAAADAADAAVLERTTGPIRRAPDGRRESLRRANYVDAQEGKIPQAAARTHEGQGVARIVDLVSANTG